MFDISALKEMKLELQAISAIKFNGVKKKPNW
jgi:hypothetical protein